MKKQILYLAGIAAIFASCSREAIEAPEETQGPRHIRIQASVEDTRTSLSIDGTTGTYSWQPMETIAVMEENGSEPCEFTVTNAVNGYFEGEATNALIGAVSPYLALESYTGTQYMLSLSGEYDYADGTNAVMVAGAPTVVPVPEGDMQKFTFKHAAGLVMITYENLPFGTKGVRFTTNKPIVGEWVFNSFENVVLNGLTTGSSTAYVMFDEPIGNDELNQPFSFYIPVPVNNYTGIEIALVDNGKNDIAGTKKKMATKQFSVALGDVVKFPTITLTPAEVQEAGYTRISSTDDLEPGQYLIVYEGGNVAFNGGLDNLDKSGNSIEVSPSEGKIEITDATTAAEFTLAAITDGYSIKSASGKYIGRTSDSNGMDQDASTVYTNTITFSGNNADIVGSGNAHLRYNASTNNGDWFRYYKSSTYTGQKAIQLYKKVAAGPVGGKTPANLSLSPTGPYYLTAGEDESFASPLVNPNQLPVTYVFETTYTSQQESDYLALDTNTGEILIDDAIPAGTISVTVTYAGSSVYEAQTLDYVVNISAPVRSISALNALITATETEFDVVFNDAIVTWVSGNYAYIQDAEAGIYVYNGATGLSEKNVLSGRTKVKAKLYKDWREISGVTGDALSTLVKDTPAEELPLDEYNLLDVYSDLTSEGTIVTENMRVKIADGGLYSVSGSTKYITTENGETKIQLYVHNGVTLTCENGDLLDYVIGYPRHFDGKNQLYIVKAEDVVVREKPVINLTNVPTNELSVEEHELTVNYSVTNPIDNASVSADSEDDWLAASANNGVITILVDSNNEGLTAQRTGLVTVSYSYAEDQTITITQSGNSFAITYATVTGGTLSGPARAKANDEVTLTATPATDNFTFNNDWEVTPATAGIAAPTVTNSKFTMPASDVTVRGSFTKNTSGDVVVLTEDFSSVTTGNSTSTGGSNSAWEGNSNFPTVVKAYQAGGAIKIGASGSTGSITSKSLDLSSNFTVAFDVKGWSSVEGDIKITVGQVTKTITYSAEMSGDFESKSVDFDAATGTSTVKIATSAKRAFLDNIVITRHD